MFDNDLGDKIVNNGKDLSAMFEKIHLANRSGINEKTRYSKDDHTKGPQRRVFKH